jgi:hypothetical protein
MELCIACSWEYLKTTAKISMEDAELKDIKELSEIFTESLI